MTPRERIFAAVEFGGPDRTPFQHFLFPGAFWRHGQVLVDFLNAHPDDFGGRNFTIPPQPEQSKEIEEYRDEWGSVWRRRRGYTCGEVVQPAIPTWEAWPGFVFPPTEDPAHFRKLQNEWSVPDRASYAMGGCGTLFEQMQWLRGSENLFVDIATDPDELHALADRLVERSLVRIRGYLEAGADCLVFADDWGAQDRLLIRPDRWRAFFKPRYRRLFEPILESGRHIWFHTDGWTVDIWEDLLELGVTILNPQHSLMPRHLLEERLAGRVCIRSDLDRQHIIPFGTPDEVRAHVADTIDLFGRFNGGLILHGEVGADVPFENIRAMVEAFVEHRK